MLRTDMEGCIRPRDENRISELLILKAAKAQSLWTVSILVIILGCVSKVESMTAERKNLQNQKEIRAECRIFL